MDAYDWAVERVLRELMMAANAEISTEPEMIQCETLWPKRTKLSCLSSHSCAPSSKRIHPISRHCLFTPSSMRHGRCESVFDSHFEILPRSIRVREPSPACGFALSIQRDSSPHLCVLLCNKLTSQRTISSLDVRENFSSLSALSFYSFLTLPSFACINDETWKYTMNTIN